ncbi:thioredoxin domain-containing protein [Planctellipticum variicoloris]|uniref:thioredoxin domain-containing protein n=1 Tax=Planctellipticum variicoloris TaxID=3064265 RepID=UPI0030133722|nr:thioredoxin domain-containing protein [Planctomycetaceae bacterium SH412]
MTDLPRHSPNRLAQETSPYLLQHANNPVDWRAWNEASLAEAKLADKPIFLSIGYSACHWCHVMEHESFENPDIAALMNDWFVNIKVDREERPDLDQIYMAAVIAMTQSGGWPMSVFLTPDLKPFFGGTYWPPESRWGRPGFRQILSAVHEAWQNRREALLEQAEQLTEAVVAAGRPQHPAGALSEETLRNALKVLVRSVDRENGGFGSAPKFPHPMDLRLLLRLWRRFGSEDALAATTLTLDKMARGGIYDHLGGGFARYSTDERWLAPHFEKMLYDNALLVPVYLEAHQITGRADFAAVARETLDYVLREMTRPEGGFYSTQDADSEGEEGKFFVWSQGEIEEALDEHEVAAFCACYDVTPQGNWEHKTILNRPESPERQAARLGLSPSVLEALLAGCRAKLFALRAERIAPGRDEKILASWNGLMIAACARVGAAFDEPRYIEAARAAGDFVLSTLVAEDGRLWHGYKDGRARFNGYLDDYAAVIDGLAELYQATFDARYLEGALALAERMEAQFADAADGGYFYTSADHETLIARSKDVHDNATPSGNSLAATALVKLALLTGRSDLEQRAVGTLEMLAGELARVPMAGAQALMAFDMLLGPAHEIVLMEGADPAECERVLVELRRRSLPNLLVIRQAAGAAVPAVLEPLLAGKTAIDGRTTAYVCRRGACQSPLVGAEAILAGWGRLTL